MILVNDNEKLNLIAQHSDLAIFSSDVAIRHNIKRPRRTAIPVLDDAAYTEYFCICKKANTEMVNFIKNLASVLPEQNIQPSLHTKSPSSNMDNPAARSAPSEKQ